MHEFALTDDLLKLARDEADRAGLARIDRITVRIGGLSGIFPDSIEFAFEFLKKENALTADAELVIEKIPGRARCSNCEKIFELDRLFLFCPDCEIPTLAIIEGEDFLLVSIEGEEKSEGGVKASLEAGDENG